MVLLFDHPVAAAVVFCGLLYALAVLALGWPFGGSR